MISGRCLGASPASFVQHSKMVVAKTNKLSLNISNVLGSYENFALVPICLYFLF